MRSLLISLLVPAYVAEILAQTRKRNHDTCNVTLPWTVPRERYDDLSDFVFSALMQCPTEFHGCSKRPMTCGSETYKLTCSCAPNCKAYGDCCWNVESGDETSKAEMSTSACVNLEVGSEDTRPAYMIVGCPHTWVEDDVKLACEQPNSLNGTFYHIPVTSINNITYRNGFCALCNDDLVNATFWNAMINTTNQKVVVGMPFIVQKKPSLHLRPCAARVLENTCPQYASERVRRKCRIYYAPVEDDLVGHVYKNVYCAICNGANLSGLSCSPAFHSKLPKTSRKKTDFTPDLAALFRPVRSTPTCYVEHDGNCYIKHRPVVCSPVSTPECGRVASDVGPSPLTPEAPKKIRSRVYSLKMYVTVVSMSLSICCLLLKIIVFCACKEARSFSAKCTMCLSMTLLLAQAMLLTTSCFALGPVLCVASAVIAHYGFLSTMTWTTAMSYDIWRNVTSFKYSTAHERALLIYGAISWGCPLGVVASAVVVDQAAPGSELAPGYGVVACWLGTFWGLIAYFLVPFFGLLLTCLLFYLRTVCYIRRTSSAVECRSRDQMVRNREYRNNLTLFVRLAIIMGAVWALTFVGIFFSNAVVDLLIDALVGLEGVYLFFAFRDHRYLCAPAMKWRTKASLSGTKTTSQTSNLRSSK